MTDPTSQLSPLQSEFASDADMQELIQMFVDEVPQRMSEFRFAWDRANAAELGRLAHQMKGAAPGYGFTPLGESAKALESALKHAAHDLTAVRREFDSLIQMCSRVAR
jgi:HPt (histidine-containing phosphotransfer) domain-containing protein